MPTRRTECLHPGVQLPHAVRQRFHALLQRVEAPLVFFAALHDVGIVSDGSGNRAKLTLIVEGARTPLIGNTILGSICTAVRGDIGRKAVESLLDGIHSAGKACVSLQRVAPIKQKPSTQPTDNQRNKNQ